MSGALTGIRTRDYLDVASARDLNTFCSRLGDAAARLDFPLVSAALVVEQPGGPAAIIPVRYGPEEYTEVARNVPNSARDPVLQRLKSTSVPFIYDQELYVQSGAGDLWEEQAPHGFRTGISLAFHLNGGRHFLLGVDRPDPMPQDMDSRMRMMADVQLLATYSQETAVRLLLPKAALNNAVPVLSAREQEILRWTRDGKTSQVIGELLNISTRTVNYHLSSAMQKLGVSSKHQAAAKANSVGLL